MKEKTLPKLLISREEAEKQIQERIDKGQQLHDMPIRSQTELDKAEAEFKKWSKYNRKLLLKLFDNSSIADEYWSLPFAGWTNATLNDKVGWYQRDVSYEVTNLEGICEQLELYSELSDTHPRTFGDKVFIVHGHNEATKHEIARFVTGLGLTAIILDEQPSKGRTIINKFKEHANEVGFAIVLLTADDVGAPKGQADEPEPRARQNVILELGYFLCGLGSDRVCILCEEGVELPSDIYGIVYVPMDKDGAWKLKLAQEMASVGITIDMNKLLPNR